MFHLRINSQYEAKEKYILKISIHTHTHTQSLSPEEKKKFKFRDFSH